jgi:hypothetical protein
MEKMGGDQMKIGTLRIINAFKDWFIKMHPVHRILYGFIQRGLHKAHTLGAQA